MLHNKFLCATLQVNSIATALTTFIKAQHHLGTRGIHKMLNTHYYKVAGKRKLGWNTLDAQTVKMFCLVQNVLLLRHHLMSTLFT